METDQRSVISHLLFVIIYPQTHFTASYIQTNQSLWKRNQVTACEEMTAWERNEGSEHVGEIQCEGYNGNDNEAKVGAPARNDDSCSHWGGQEPSQTRWGLHQVWGARKQVLVIRERGSSKDPAMSYGTKTRERWLDLENPEVWVAQASTVRRGTAGEKLRRYKRTQQRITLLATK